MALATQHWSFPRIIENSGLDVVGVRGVDQRAEADLTPGVTTVTPRLRYYTLFPWSLYAFWHTYVEDGEVRVPQSVLDRHRRRLNLVIVMATKITAPKLTRVVGINSLSGHDLDHESAMDLDALLADLTPAHAYWQYVMPLHECGLLVSRGGRPHLTPEGEGVAKAVASMPGMENLADALETGTVPAGALRLHAADWSLTALMRPENHAERDAIANVMYGAKLATDGQRRTLRDARSATAALLLAHAGRDTEQDLAGVGPKWERDRVLAALDRYEWFHLLVPSSVDGELPPALRLVAADWRALQARRVLSALVEHMLARALDALPEGRSKSKSQWLRDVLAGYPPPLLQWMKVVGLRRPTRSTLATDWLSRVAAIDADLNRAGLQIAYEETAEESAPASFLLAALTLIAWLRRLTVDGQSQVYGEMSPPFVSLSGFDALENEWANRRALLVEAMAELVDRWALRQHRHTALRKFRHDMKCTLRFYEEDDLVWASGLYFGADFSGLRTRSVFDHLQQLGLIDDDGYRTDVGGAHLAGQLGKGAE